MKDQIDNDRERPRIVVRCVPDADHVSVEISMNHSGYESHQFLKDVFPAIQNPGQAVGLLDKYPGYKSFLSFLDANLRARAVKNLKMGNPTNARWEISFDLE